MLLDCLVLGTFEDVQKQFFAKITPILSQLDYLKESMLLDMNTVEPFHLLLYTFCIFEIILVFSFLPM